MGKMCTSSMPKMRQHAYIEKKVSTHKIRNIKLSQRPNNVLKVYTIKVKKFRWLKMDQSEIIEVNRVHDLKLVANMQSQDKS